MKYSINYKSFFYLWLIIILDLFSCKKINNNFISFTDDEEITIITSDNETKFIEAIQKLNENGGTIYIDTPVINFIKRNVIEIEEDFIGGIIGIKHSNGEYPLINFIKGGQDLYSGINIIGSNKYIKYIIIENVIDNEVSIIGNNNILEHVIS